MANLLPLTSQEAQIASLFLLSNTHEQIANSLGVTLAVVETTIQKDNVKKYMRELEIQDLTDGARLDKVRAIKGILPKIIDGLNKILNEVSAEKWNKNHVELMKLMLAELPKEEAKAIQNIVHGSIIVNNNNFQEKKSESSELDALIQTLPSNVQSEFFMEVISLAKQYARRATAIETV